MNGDAPTLALQIVVAVSLLMLGRKLYWVFVAGIGFVVAMGFAADFLEPGDDWVPLAMAVGAGVIGALLFVFVQRLAIGLAGFLAAAYLARLIATGMSLESPWELVASLVGGVIGAIVAGVLFDWALILLSSLAGAVLLVDAFDLQEQAAVVVVLVVSLVGISIQTNMLRRDRKKKSD